MSDIVDDLTVDYIRQTLAPSTPLLAQMEQYAKEHHVPIIHKECKALLEVLTKIYNPKNVLEIGMAIGYSGTVMLTNMAEDGELTTIERNTKMTDIAIENFEKAGVRHRVHILEGDAQEILPCLSDTYDMIFLDAAKGYYLEFLPMCLDRLKKGGVLVSDNVLYRGMISSEEKVVHRQRTIVNRMRDYLDTICNTEGLKSSIIPIGDGMAITYKL